MRKHSRRVTKKTLRLISNGRSVYEGARLQPIGALFLVLTREGVQDGKSMRMLRMLKAIGNCRCSCYSPTITRGNVKLQMLPKRYQKKMQNHATTIIQQK